MEYSHIVVLKNLVCGKAEVLLMKIQVLLSDVNLLFLNATAAFVVLRTALKAFLKHVS